MSGFMSCATVVAKARRSAALLFALGAVSQSHAATDDAVALSQEARAALQADAETRGRGVAYDSQGYLRVQDGLHWWYIGRVATEVSPATSALPTGLHRHPRRQPAGLYDYVLIYDDAQGRRMEQVLLPASASWDTLQTALHEIPGVTDVAHDSSGDLRVIVDGRPLYGRLAPLVSTTIAMWVNPETHLLWAGDQNGDGTGDYYVIYPRQSLIQVLYVYPQRP